MTAPRTAALTKQSASPKKASPKQASVKKSRKSFLVRLPFHLWDAVNLKEKSEEMVIDEDTDHREASIAEVSRPATTPATKPKSDTSSDTKLDNNTGEAVGLEEEGTPDPSAANTRRGLRNRKPAQQRPYYHDAQVFEDVETEEEDDNELEVVSREDSLEAPLQSKPKHFKGKGRAWKKDGSDEDEEFVTPKEKKAAQAAKAKADRGKVKIEKTRAEEEKERKERAWNFLNTLLTTAFSEADLSPFHHDIPEYMLGQIDEDSSEDTPKDTPKQKKKLGRSKKNLSEDTVRDESDNDAPQTTPSQPPKRGRGRPRKSALSSEIVRDDSEDETPAATEQPPPQVQRASSPSTDLITPPKTKTTSRPSTAKSTAEATTPKKRGRPRKSSATTTPATSSSKPNRPTNDYNPQRRDSNATDAEPTTTRVKASISSTPDDYPVPNLNRGAALIESLHPREQSEPSHASSASTPAAPMAPSMLPASAPAEDKTEPSAVDAQSSATPQGEQGMGMDTAPTPVYLPLPVPDSVPAPAPAPAEVKHEFPAEPQVEGEDEGNMSAAMSLGSDSEL